MSLELPAFAIGIQDGDGFRRATAHQAVTTCALRCMLVAVSRRIGNLKPACGDLCLGESFGKGDGRRAAEQLGQKVCPDAWKKGPWLKPHRTEVIYLGG